MYLITEYQRLKEIETNRYNLEWNVKRILSKTNYLIHTDAIKENIIPQNDYAKSNEWIVYAEEADLLNVAIYNCKAKDWREVNSEHANKGLNIRDFSSINELVVISNLENANAIMINENIDKVIRYKQLKKIAKSQLKTLDKLDFMKSLKKINETTFISEEIRQKK